MKICSEGHPEICFDDAKFCPCCDLNDQLDTANNDLDTLRDDYAVAEDRIKELEIQLEPEREPPERDK